jgi:hypothetical protein
MGENPKGTVKFLRLIKKIEMMEWNWNDGIGNRGRHPACLVITAQGLVFKFTGSDIPGVVRVLKENYVKNGKWSNTTFSCISPQGTTVYSWRQSWEEGLYWPQASWEEAVETVRKVAPQVNPSSLKGVIRMDWGKAAEKFDENDKAALIFAEPGQSTVARCCICGKDTAKTLPSFALEGGILPLCDECVAAVKAIRENK